jgi:hypothetical protein
MIVLYFNFNWFKVFLSCACWTLIFKVWKNKCTVFCFLKFTLVRHIYCLRLGKTAASQPRRTQLESSLPWKPQMSHREDRFLFEVRTRCINFTVTWSLIPLHPLGFAYTAKCMPSTMHTSFFEIRCICASCQSSECLLDSDLLHEPPSSFRNR